MSDALKVLKKYGQRRDVELAEEIGLSVTEVRKQMSAGAASGDVIMCKVTRFDKGVQFDGWEYRVSGHIPAPAPGRKAKVVA